MRLLLLFAIAACFSNAPALRNKEKERKRDNLKMLASINLCTNDEPDAQIHCFCVGGSGLGNVTTAECWVFNDKLNVDYPGWHFFSSQPHIKSLRILVKPHGNLTFIPSKALIYLKDLHKFELSYGSIEEIRGFAFANLTQLTHLKLTRNKITTLAQRAVAHLHNLQELNLDENHMQELQRDVLVDLPAMKKLFIRQNRLNVIQDGAFMHLNKLLELELTTNFVSVLTKDTFQRLEYLRRLDLSFNKIKILGDLTFSELWLLEELLLESNQIEMITDRAFAGLTNLRLLNMKNNKLTLLSPMLFGGVPGIHYLDLRSNNLATLTLENVRPIIHNMYNNTSYFYVENNNFICDCRLVWTHSLRNETKNEKIRRQFEKLLCYWDQNTHDGDDHLTNKQLLPQSAMHAELAVGNDEDFDEASYDSPNDYNYDHQQDSSSGQKSLSEFSHSDVVETTRNPSERYFLQIPISDLPCPQTEMPTEGTLRKNLNTPAYADTNAARSYSVMSTFLYILLMLIFRCWS